MTCTACGSSRVQLIKVFAGHNAMSWSPVAGEKDIFGHYKKLRPLHAHACNACGHVMWNIRIDPEPDTGETAAALGVLADEREPAEDSALYTLGDELA